MPDISVLDQAQELLGRNPLPDDIEERIAALYEQASELEKPMFGWIYEGLIVAQNMPTGTPPVPVVPVVPGSQKVTNRFSFYNIPNLSGFAKLWKLRR